MKGIIIKIFICFFAIGMFLYSYMEKQNQLTSLKFEVPLVAKEIEDLKEEIKKIKYEVEMFENPVYLMQLSRNPEYGHLKHPLIEDVLTIPEGVALFSEKESLSQ